MFFWTKTSFFDVLRLLKRQLLGFDDWSDLQQSGF